MKRLILILAFTFAGCSASTRHIAVAADRSIFEVLNDIHSGEQMALCGLSSCAGSSKVETVPGWTLAKSQAFNQKLLPAVDAGRQFNSVLATWQPGTPTPPQIVTLINSLGQSLTAIVADFPAGSTRTTIVQDIQIAQSAALAAFQIVLTVKGA
jgi:hypothetical protein